MPARTVHVVEYLAEKMREYGIEKPLPIALGGYGPNITITDLSAEERRYLDDWFENTKKLLAWKSPVLAKIFEEHEIYIREVLVPHFKALTGGTLQGDQPQSTTQFGIDLLSIPLLKSSTAPIGYAGNDWLVSLTAGTNTYLLGSSTDLYTFSSETGKRAMALIFRNGLIVVGTSLKFDIVQIKTQTSTYPAFVADPALIKAADANPPIYVIKTPYPFMITHNFGSKIIIKPFASGDQYIMLFGVAVYEVNAIPWLET